MPPIRHPARPIPITRVEFRIHFQRAIHNHAINYRCAKWIEIARFDSWRAIKNCNNARTRRCFFTDEGEKKDRAYNCDRAEFPKQSSQLYPLIAIGRVSTLPLRCRNFHFCLLFSLIAFFRANSNVSPGLPFWSMQVVRDFEWPSVLWRRQVYSLLWKIPNYLSSPSCKPNDSKVKEKPWSERYDGWTKFNGW